MAGAVHGTGLSIRRAATKESATMGMRSFRAIGALLIGGMVLAAAQAEPWPSRPIRWIVPYPPGGGTDLVSRAVGAKLSEYLGQPIVIDNRPGGNTIIGTAALAQASPDGYTLALITDAHAINAAAEKVM